MALDLTRYRNLLGKIPGTGAYLSQAMQDIQDAVNQGFASIGASANTTLDAPPPVGALNVKTDGNGNVHAVITDENKISKHLNYFVEYATNPAFNQSHVEHLGVSRTLKPFPLPNFDDNGNQQTFYFRAYSMYPGGQPGPKINFGAKNNPTAVTPGGTSRMTLLTSTGAGTAPNTGQQPGLGFGSDLVRPAAATQKTTAA
jgi:hypothetical protein